MNKSKIVFWALISSLIMPAILIFALSSGFAQSKDSTQTREIEPKILPRGKPLPGYKEKPHLSQEEIEKRVAKEREEYIKKYRPLVPKMIEEIQDTKRSPDKRTMAIAGLGKVFDMRAIEPLIKILLIDTAAICRGYAAEAIGSICEYNNSKIGIEPLKTALDDIDKGVVIHAALALIKLDEYNSTIPVFKSVLIGEDKEQWQVEGHSFLSTRKKGEEYKKSREQMKYRLRELAIDVLFKIANEQAKEALEEAAVTIVDYKTLKRNAQASVRGIEKKLQK